MHAGKGVVLYLEKGSSKELFSEAMTWDEAERKACELDTDGKHNVIAVITAEHAAERQLILKPDGGLMEGAHLHSFLNDIVRQFRQDYPGLPQEAALKAIAVLCSLRLEGRRDLQGAFLDQVHSQAPLGADDWRLHMRIALANRPPEDGS